MNPFTNENPFWMVWNPLRGAPSFQHHSEDEAKKEAARLARTRPGEKFFVLEAVGCVLKQDVLWHGFRQRDEDLPF